MKLRGLHQALDPRAWLFASSIVVSLVACGGGDDERERSPYPGVSRWECFADTASGVCDCYGLGRNEEVLINGSSIEEVNECSGYAECKTFYDEEFEDWLCSCGPVGFTPGAFGDYAARDAVPACPPED
ncbi:MAG TPA: hypothetical protein VGK73_34615 [Polyangiaceae bacterium]